MRESPRVGAVEDERDARGLEGLGKDHLVGGTGLGPPVGRQRHFERPDRGREVERLRLAPFGDGGALGGSETGGVATPAAGDPGEVAGRRGGETGAGGDTVICMRVMGTPLGAAMTTNSP